MGLSALAGKATGPGGTGYCGELPDRLAKAQRFIDAGWVFSHTLNAEQGLCDDGTCYRCRLVALLAATESMVLGVDDIARASRESESGVDLDHLRPHQRPCSPAIKQCKHGFSATHPLDNKPGYCSGPFDVVLKDGVEEGSKMNKRTESLLRKANLIRSMLIFLEKSVEHGEVIQAATVVKTITETAGEIAYESGRYNQELLCESEHHQRPSSTHCWIFL